MKILPHQSGGDGSTYVDLQGESNNVQNHVARTTREHAWCNRVFSPGDRVRVNLYADLVLAGEVQACVPTDHYGNVVTVRVDRAYGEREWTRTEWRGTAQRVTKEKA